MNRAQADELIEIVKGDASLQYMYYDGQGNACFVGGLAQAKGFEVEPWIKKVLDWNEDNEGIRALVDEHGNGRGQIVCAYQDATPGDPLYELVTFLRPHLEALGLTDEDMQNMQSINDAHLDTERRHIALISYVESLVED